MQVKEIMTRTVETIESDASLVEAARKMRSLEVGALPIWENGELVGMITDRDITIRGVADEKRWRQQHRVPYIDLRDLGAGYGVILYDPAVLVKWAQQYGVEPEE